MHKFGESHGQFPNDAIIGRLKSNFIYIYLIRVGINHKEKKAG